MVRTRIGKFLRNFQFTLNTSALNPMITGTVHRTANVRYRLTKSPTAIPPINVDVFCSISPHLYPIPSRILSVSLKTIFIYVSKVMIWGNPANWNNWLTSLHQIHQLVNPYFIAYRKNGGCTMCTVFPLFILVAPKTLEKVIFLRQTLNFKIFFEIFTTNLQIFHFFFVCGKRWKRGIGFVV